MFHILGESGHWEKNISKLPSTLFCFTVVSETGLLCENRYKMPLALVGILSVVTVWDYLRRAGEDWGLERTGYRYRGLALLGNIGIAS